MRLYREKRKRERNEAGGKIRSKFYKPNIKDRFYPKEYEKLCAD